MMGLLHTPTTGDSHPTYEKRYPGGKVRPSPIPNLAAEIEEGVAYIDRRSSPTSSPSTAPDSEAQLCLPGASPASLSVTPGSAEARKMTVQSGLKCLELSTSRGPLGSLEKMLAASSAWNSTKCLLTWKWKATPAGRSILELSASTPRTAGCESGLLHTPKATEHLEDRDRFVERMGDRTANCFPNLETQIASIPLLKTPSSVETEGGVMEIRPGCDGHYKLRDQIAMLRTPQAGDADHGGPNARDSAGGLHLTAQIAMLPTPAARDYRGSFADNSEAYLDRLEHPRGVNLVEELQRQANGTSRGLKLQPAFVEWMQGYPLGFTHIESPDSKHSATPSSRKSPTKSSRQSRKSK